MGNLRPRIIIPIAPYYRTGTCSHVVIAPDHEMETFLLSVHLLGRCFSQVKGGVELGQGPTGASSAIHTSVSY